MNRASVVLTVVLLQAACVKEVPLATPEPTSLDVGVHRITLVEPEGWQHLDHGLEHIYRNELELIGVRDLGLRPPPEEEGGATFDEWIERDLPSLGFGRQRAIAGRETRSVQGREVVIVDTWDRLTHEHRRRFAFYWNEGHMLVVYSKQGHWEAIRPAIEQIVDTMTFIDDDSVTRYTP